MQMQLAIMQFTFSEPYPELLLGWAGKVQLVSGFVLYSQWWLVHTELKSWEVPGGAFIDLNYRGTY